MTKRRHSLVGKTIIGAIRFGCDRTGAAVVEFAMLAPVLFMLLIGTFQFGIVINQYIQLTEATRVGGRTLAISRGTSTPIATTKNAVYASAPSLTQGNMGFTIYAGATQCTTVENTCSTALTNNQGGQATITVSYNACSAFVFGKDYLPSCNLSSTTSVRIE
ncbi:MAG: TadE/TadG family type IV pilus assembly protein [Sphingomonadales bacterium]